MVSYRASPASMRLARAALKHYGSYDAMFAAARKGENGVHYIDLPAHVREELRLANEAEKAERVSFWVWLIEWVIYIAIASFFAVGLGFNWWQTLLSMAGVALVHRFVGGLVK